MISMCNILFFSLLNMMVYYHSLILLSIDVANAWTIKHSKQRTVISFRHKLLYWSLDATTNEAYNEDLAQEGEDDENTYQRRRKSSTYDLGAGKNLPVGSITSSSENNTNSTNPANSSVNEKIDADILGSIMGNGKLKWNIPKPTSKEPEVNSGPAETQTRRVRKMVARNQESNVLRGAIWHEEHFSNSDTRPSNSYSSVYSKERTAAISGKSGKEDETPQSAFPKPTLFYPDIDLSIPSSIYDPETGTDIVWYVYELINDILIE